MSLIVKLVRQRQGFPTNLKIKTSFFHTGRWGVLTVDSSPEMLFYSILGPTQTSRSSRIDPVVASEGQVKDDTFLYVAFSQYRACQYCALRLAQCKSECVCDFDLLLQALGRLESFRMFLQVPACCRTAFLDSKRWFGVAICLYEKKKFLFLSSLETMNQLQNQAQL